METSGISGMRESDMDLLVRATRYSDWDPGVVFAARLAGQLRGSLTAMNVVQAGIPPVWEYNTGVLLAEYVAALEEQLAAARRAAPAFEAWAQSMGAAFPRWLVTAGHIGDALRYAGNWHDLVVLARDDADPWSNPAGLASIALHVDRPCLVVPPGREQLDLECIAVAWNNSIEAIRAIHGALPLLRRAKRIVMLMGKPKTAQSALGLPEFEMEAWCRRHELAIEFQVLDDNADQGGPIHEAARAAYAGLLVMGAYGRTRFAERILGGVTRYMLRQADLPLLLRH
jgi:nucleotide-binding universal stress UspA family protein